MRVPEVHPGTCSACFTSPDVPFVDFEVFWDGPVIPLPEEGKEPVEWPRVQIDDLFLCSNCLKEAARLIGLGDVSEVDLELERLKSEVLELRQYRLDAEKRLNAAQTAFEGRSVAKATPKRQGAKKAAGNNA